jgi:hypothetical protein
VIFDSGNPCVRVHKESAAGQGAAMKSLIKGIGRTHLKTFMEKIWTICCDMGYVLAMLIWLVIIPLALLFRAVTAIKAALHSGQITQRCADPVIVR